MLPRSVEVGVFPTSMEAGLARGLLEEEGIAAQIDGLTAQSWLTGEVPITGFRLMVRAEDVERAVHVLDHAQEGAAFGASDLPDDAETGAEPDLEPPVASAAAPDATPLPRSPAREAVGPMAALLLGMLCWAPFAMAVAGVWCISLLRSPLRRQLGPRTRALLIGGTALAVAEAALLLALGWPRRVWPFGGSLLGWLVIDVLLAAAALAGWISATRRWPAR